MDSPGEAGPTESWLVRVRGRVQGVGYRDACVQHARAAGIRGWVRNRADGSVELTLQGAPEAVAAMSSWLRHSVPGARVTDMEATPLHGPVQRFASFERLATE